MSTYTNQVTEYLCLNSLLFLHMVSPRKRNIRRRIRLCARNIACTPCNTLAGSVENARQLFKECGRTQVERSLMVRWVVGSILHGVGPLSYFSFQPVLHDWCNKDRGMCYPVCGMVHIKEPLLLIDKSSLCGGSGFPFSLSEWSLTICLTPYNRR